MFANQVIKSFKKQIINKMNGMNDKGALNNMKYFSDGHLVVAEKYHMGSDDMLGFIDRQAKKMSTDQVVFMGPAAIEVELPYDMCWFDFIDTKFLGHIDDRMDDISLKCGIFAANMNSIEDVRKGEPRFLQITPIFQFGPTNTWCFANNSFIIKVGSKLTRDEAADIFKRFTHPDKFTNIYLKEHLDVAVQSNLIKIPMLDYVNKEEFSDPQNIWWNGLCEHIGLRCISILNMFLMILNCKNVITETVSTKKKKKKKRSNQIKGYTYKVLKFKLPKSRQKDSMEYGALTKFETSAPLSTHCGHYKTYTEEAPLFGKVVGRWWWHSHVRGDEKNGVIDKDYNPISDN